MKTDKIFLIFALTFLLVAPTLEKLQVLSPDSLADDLPKGKMEFTPAHYGDLPYGGSLVGFVHELEKNHDGCRTIPQLDAFDDDDNQPILLVPRGGCQFLTKSLHAQHAGAKMLIVISDSDELDFDPIADINVGKKVKIPTVFVTKSAGEKVMKVLESTDEAVRRSVILEFTLPLPTTDMVTLNVVMTANDKQAHNFFQVFKNHTEQLGSRFKIEPIYYWDSIEDPDVYKDVYNKGEICYNNLPNMCLPDVDFQTGEVHLTQMSHICLHEQVLDQATFMEFLSEYGKQCLSNHSFGIFGYTNSEATQNTYQCRCPDGNILNVGTSDKDDGECKTHQCFGAEGGECIQGSELGKNLVAFCGNEDKRLQMSHLHKCSQAVLLQVSGHRKRRANGKCVQDK